MNSADRALTTELVYGTLRNQQHLDFLLSRVSKRPIRKIHPVALTAIRMGAHQIINLRIPDHSAVNESVALVAARQKHAKGFANAILRKLALLHASNELPHPLEVLNDPLEALAVTGSHPLWLLQRIQKRFGESGARDFVAANNAAPKTFLRVNRCRSDRDSLLAKLAEEDLIGEAVEGIPDAIRMQSTGNIQEMPGFENGEFVVQDLAAQLVARVAAPEPGQVILDMCAAPGGKSTHLAELMGDEGKVIALDIHPGRTRLISQNAERLRLKSVATSARDSSDAELLRGALENNGADAADIVIIDAPCSGLGTIRRNPELRARVEAELPVLCQLQDDLLDAGAQVLKPGGILVYAVCTITEEEGPERIAAFVQRHPGFSVETPEDPVLQPFLQDEQVAGITVSAVRTWQHRDQCDGFYSARLRRH